MKGSIHGLRLICPWCEERVQELNWEATLVRSNISEAGVIGGAVFDRVFSVPPGTWTAQPCGHEVDETQLRAWGILG